jgi:hypothetical protein
MNTHIRPPSSNQSGVLSALSSTPESWIGAAVLHSPGAMLLTGVLLGFMSITINHSVRIPWGNKFSAEDTFDSFGWESVSIAASIAQGKGFSSPFGVPSGPTAWLAPVYPYLLAGLFRVFGLYSEASAIAIDGINVILLALTSAVLFRIATHLFNQHVATWAGWIWSVLPCLLYLAENSYFTSPYFSSTFIAWESAMSTFALSALLLLSLEIVCARMPYRWVVFGLSWGFAALTNPALLSLLPFSMGRVCIRLRREGKDFWAPLGTTLLVLGLTVAPWIIRNYHFFGRVIFIRSNLGAELHYGNLPVSEGIWIVHPDLDASELAKYVQLGEIHYIQHCWAEFFGFVHRNPERFLTLIFRRMVFYWAGEPAFSSGLGIFSDFTNTPYTLSSVLGIWGLMVAWRRRRDGVGLLTALMFSFPAVYYMSHAMTRYRAPLEPEMVMLSIFLIQDTLRGGNPSAAASVPLN